MKFSLHPWEWIYLEGPTTLSGTPLHLISWLYLSRSLIYLLQRAQSSVRFPHTSYKHNCKANTPYWVAFKLITRSKVFTFKKTEFTWCSARSTAGNGNSQNSHVAILWGQFSPLWMASISRSIVSLHSEQATCFERRIRTKQLYKENIICPGSSQDNPDQTKLADTSNY